LKAAELYGSVGSNPTLAASAALIDFQAER
jgi:hypothetical protein